MKVLVVGGTGLTGAHAALHLRDRGHEVTLMARSQPQTECLKSFAFLQGNYMDDTFQVTMLGGFDAMVFAAGADIRMLPSDETGETFFMRANAEAIPCFFSKARDAGIHRAVYIGTYYPQVVPEKINTSAYVRSRYLADEAVRALDSDTFTICSLNAPFIIGHVPGLIVPHLQALAHYAAGRIEGMSVAAPAGGVNHISSQSMSEAIASALECGKGGKAYLVGDENLTWKEYFETWFAAAGNPQELVVSTDEHPMLPDVILYAGRNASISYQPQMDEISYSQGNIKKTIDGVAKAYL